MSWGEHIMSLAAHVASKSKDSTKVGAVLVGDGNVVILTAYNGPPRGVADTPDRFERPAKYLFASHAEANLIAFAAREGVRTAGKAVYCTHHPCSSCARTMIQAGIARIHVGNGTTRMPPEEFDAARLMFGEAGVPVVLHEPDVRIVEDG
jgi:dCMP deaminase